VNNYLYKVVATYPRGSCTVQCLQCSANSKIHLLCSSAVTNREKNNSVYTDIKRLRNSSYSQAF